MPLAEIENDTLVYKGSNFFKQRLLLSTLSGKPVKIKDIRSSEVDPGLREFEVGLVRLLDKVTNGTVIELNKSGTSLYFRPGLLHGGTITHDCSLQRGIGYYIDVLLAVGPFCKNPLNVIFKGITNSKESPSVDHIKAAAFPILKKFIVVDDGLELKVKKRGVLPDGGGEVHFKCPVRKSLRSLQVLKPGMVKRIRGTAFTCKVSPAMANRAGKFQFCHSNIFFKSKSNSSGFSERCNVEVFTRRLYKYRPKQGEDFRQQPRLWNQFSR